MNYKHGGRVFEAADILAVHWSEIIDFSANINPLGHLAGLKEHLFNNFNTSLHYPDIFAEKLSKTFAQKLNLEKENICFGAGSTPQMYFLARSLNIKKAAIIGPSFAEYEKALKTSEVEFEYYLTKEEDDFVLKKELLHSIKGVEAIFLANPFNPTGHLVDKDVLEELLLIFSNTYLIIDEAFIDFAQEATSLIEKVKTHKKLIVLRSLTKIYALPGLRLAYLAAHKELLQQFKAKIEPWAISSIATEAAFFCLENTSFLKETKKSVKELKKYLIENLKALEMFKIYPSASNYLLIKLNSLYKPNYLLNYLFEKGILIRDASNFVGLGEGFLRLAVRPKNEIDILINELKRFKNA